MESASSSSLKLILQEFKNINKRALYEDNQVSLEFPNGEGNVYDLRVILKPNFGPYEGARIPFRLQLPRNYPLSPPVVKCEVKVFHPNISLTGSVCFSMFAADYDKSYRLEHYINGLLWLLNNPNPDSALNANAIIRDPKEFNDIVKFSLKGSTVSGTFYTKLLPLDYEIEYIAVDNLFNERLVVPEFVPASILLGKLPSKCYLNNYVDKDLDVHFGKLPGMMKKISQAHKALKVDPILLLKELLFKVDDMFVLVISHGYGSVDTKWISEIYKASSCRLALVDEILKFSCNHDSLPALKLCHLVHQVLVNESLINIEENTHIYTTMGYSNCLLKMRIGLFLKSLSKDNVRILPFHLLPLPTASNNNNSNNV